ncbi:MAG TPA: hypothetical protein VIJ39_12635 [Solirubrobacteraceae bacterium]
MPAESDATPLVAMVTAKMDRTSPHWFARGALPAAKSAMLYADRVTLSEFFALTGGWRSNREHYANSDSTGVVSVFEAIRGTYHHPWNDPYTATAFPVPPGLEPIVNELKAAKEAGALDVPERGWNDEDSEVYLRSNRFINVDTELKDLGRNQPYDRRHTLEGTLASRVLGSLEAFPDAEMDVLLDVRDADISDLDDLISEVKLRTIDPAIENLHDELDSLRVRRTLQRLTSDPRALTAGAAALSLGLQASGVVTALGSAGGAMIGSSALVAAAAREAELRQDAQSQLRQRPFWLLHEVDRLTRRSGRR